MFSGHTLRPTGTSRAHHARLAFKISISFYKTIYSDEYVHLKLTVFTDSNDDVARMQYANQSAVVNFHSFLCLLHHLPYYFFLLSIANPPSSELRLLIFSLHILA